MKGTALLLAIVLLCAAMLPVSASFAAAAGNEQAVLVTVNVCDSSDPADPPDRSMPFVPEQSAICAHTPASFLANQQLRIFIPLPLSWQYEQPPDA